jgi:hypothetical protein
MNKTQKHANVVSIADYRETQGLKSSEGEYKEYLTLLKAGELENEVLHILDDSKSLEFDLSLSDKSKLIFSEIADRTTQPISKYIQNLKGKLEL